MRQDWLAIAASPFIGSFLGVLIRRLPAGKPVLWGRSKCEHCGHTLGAAELVPLLSFVLLRGRCRHCGAPIAPSHIFVECAAIAVAASATFASSDEIFLLGCLLGWMLLALGWIDADTFWLPDALTLPLIVAGLAVTWWLAPWSLADHALAAIFGYASFRLISGLYAWWRGREGLGQGDAKLLAAGGAWLGLAAFPALLLGAALVGLLIALALRLAGRDVGRTTAIPFGPAIAASIWGCWLWAAS